jgi:molybdopterin-guanine dinucleotide biosynthesis protein B
VVCIVGFSGSGKTTVMVGLVAVLKERGLCVGTIKHDVHGFEIDRPGKVSWRHKQASALTTIISSPAQIGMVMDVDPDHQPLELVPLLGEIDIVLVQGFKRVDLLKIEVLRPENEKPPVCRIDRHLLAVVSNTKLDWCVPNFDANDYKGLAEFILEQFRLDPLIDRGFEQTACG